MTPEPEEVGYSPEPAAPESPEKAQEASGSTIEQRTTLLGGVTGKGFMPGHSGNPAGRPPGIVALVKEKTRDGLTIVKLMDRVHRGKKFKRTIPREDGTGVDVSVRPSIQDRMDAAAWLADRGWGKAKDVGEEAPRRPFVVRLQGDTIEDPFEEPEAEAAPDRKLPALPAPMPEIGFDMNLKDLEEKP